MINIAVKDSYAGVLGYFLRYPKEIIRVLEAPQRHQVSRQQNLRDGRRPIFGGLRWSYNMKIGIFSRKRLVILLTNLLELIRLMPQPVGDEKRLSHHWEDVLYILSERRRKRGIYGSQAVRFWKDKIIERRGKRELGAYYLLGLNKEDIASLGREHLGERSAKLSSHKLYSELVKAFSRQRLARIIRDSADIEEIERRFREEGLLRAEEFAQASEQGLFLKVVELTWNETAGSLAQLNGKDSQVEAKTTSGEQVVLLPVAEAVTNQAKSKVKKLVKGLKDIYEIFFDEWGLRKYAPKEKLEGGKEERIGGELRNLWLLQYEAVGRDYRGL